MTASGVYRNEIGHIIVNLIFCLIAVITATSSWYKIFGDGWNRHCTQQGNGRIPWTSTSISRHDFVLTATKFKA